MEFLTEWWGLRENITPAEIAARAAAMFIAMLVMLRFSDMRSFGKGSVFDNVIIILLGSVLGRGVVGATPFFSALAGGITLLVVHKILSELTFSSKKAGRYIKGKPVLLFSDGEFIQSNMKITDITEHDIMEELRLSCNLNDLAPIKEVYMERSGKISFVKKEPQKDL